MLSSRPLSYDEYFAEASTILDKALKSGVTLKLIGALAFMKHCPSYVKLAEKANRPLTDIDFVGYSSQRDEVTRLFKSIGYTYDVSTYMETALLGRLIFTKKDNPSLHVDVFLDKLQMCHTIEFKDRLAIEKETIPLAEMFLEKMQIVKIAEKDIKDVLILLLDHEVGDSDDETINISQIAKILSRDWGFYYTVTQNLQRVLGYLAGFDVLGERDKEEVRRKIFHILSFVEKTPKSLSWKLRSKVGSKIKWYEDVEEAVRRSV